MFVPVQGEWCTAARVTHFEACQTTGVRKEDNGFNWRRLNSPGGSKNLMSQSSVGRDGLMVMLNKLRLRGGKQNQYGFNPHWNTHTPAIRKHHSAQIFGRPLHPLHQTSAEFVPLAAFVVTPHGQGLHQFALSDLQARHGSFWSWLNPTVNNPGWACSFPSSGLSSMCSLTPEIY